MITKFIITFLCVFTFTFLNAQTDDVYYGTNKTDTTKIKKTKNTDWLKKFTYGGNFSVYFNNATYINVTPTIGYNVFKNLNVGTGFIYNYFSKDYGGQYGRVTQTIYGGRVYARYLVTPTLFLQGQYDKLLQPDFYNTINPKQKVWVDYAFVGGGYRYILGNKAALIATLLYNLTYNPLLSIYPSPLVFQLSFVGGF